MRGLGGVGGRHCLGWLVVCVFACAGAASARDVPEVVAVLLDQAARHSSAGRVERAVDDYLRAVELAPTFPQAYLGLGALLQENERFEEALELFEGGLEHRPEDTELLFGAAVSAHALGLQVAALGYLERALELGRDPNHLALYGVILARTGQTDAAIEILREAEHGADSRARILLQLGNLLFGRGDLDAAIDAFSRAAEARPDLLQAHFNLGAALAQAGRADEAVHAYEVALEPVEGSLRAGESVDPRHADAYLNLGGIHFRRQSWRQAVAAYQRALQLRPDEARALYNLGFIYFHLGDDVEATRAYRAALEIDPQLPFAFLHLGILSARAGDPAAAVYWLERGSSYYDPASRREAGLELAGAHRALGDHAAAEAALGRLLADDANDVDALVRWSRVLRSQGRSGEVSRRFSETDGVAKSWAAQVELAMLEGPPGASEQQVVHYRRALDLLGSTSEPARAAIEANLALSLLARGQIEEGIAGLGRSGRTDHGGSEIRAGDGCSVDGPGSRPTRRGRSRRGQRSGGEGAIRRW